MNYLSEIKTILDNTYKNLSNIESFGIDTNIFKRKIKEFDGWFEKYDNNSNSAVEVKYTKTQKKDLYTVYNTVKSLEKSIIEINMALSLIPYLKTIKPSLNKNTSHEEISKITEEILNRLLAFNNQKNILDITMLDKDIDTIYQIIKYEYKYTGKSLILYYMYKNDMLSDEFYELWTKDYEKYHLTGKYNSVYFFYESIFKIALIEDGYLQEKEEPLEEIKKEYELNNIKKEKRLETINDKKTENRKRRYNISKLYSRLIPMLLSFNILVTANVLSYGMVKDKSPYKTTIETYSSIDKETTTEDTYSKMKVGDTTIIVYYPTDSKGARIIKSYDYESGESLNISDSDFTSSVYKVDNEANNASTDQFMVIKTVKEIDEEDKNLSVGLAILSSIGISGLLIVSDILIKKLLEYKSDAYMLSDLFVTNIPYEIKSEKQSIDINYPKASITNDKEKLKNLRKELARIKKEYEEYYKEYLYMEPFLEEDGYTRKLK